MLSYVINPSKTDVGKIELQKKIQSFLPYWFNSSLLKVKPFHWIMKSKIISEIISKMLEFNKCKMISRNCSLKPISLFHNSCFPSLHLMKSLHQRHLSKSRVSSFAYMNIWEFVVKFILLFNCNRFYIVNYEQYQSFQKSYIFEQM